MRTVPVRDRGISHSELLAGISSHEIKRIAHRARVQEFLPGEVIHVADDPILHVLLLTQGLIKKSQSTESGHEVILRLCVPGEIISEPTLISGRTHNSRALAMEHCKALAWDVATFNAILKGFPKVRRNAERILECRLAELNQCFVEVSTKAASARLAIRLIRLASRIGACLGDHIELRISQETLAQMSGMTLSSVFRLLSIWKEQGIVKLRREMIEIHSLPQLLRCAEAICTPSERNLMEGEALSPHVLVPAGGPDVERESAAID